MYCPKCRSEYRDDIQSCAHCEVALVAALATNDAYATPEGMARLLAEEEAELVEVVSGPHVELRRLQVALAQRQIATVIRGESDAVEAAVHERFFLLSAERDLEQVREFFAEERRTGLALEGIAIPEVDRDDDDDDDDDDAAGEVAGDAEGASEATPCPACATLVPVESEVCPECELFVGAG